ncbi:YczE/YyaS/YitT family protein [Anaeromicropila herbilytica]|uniref:Membrane protein n=1 Tax=Anaeromicropila herbilytica TaxID=2785025 RepID=A0A7R7EMS5_9FIRM|nr:DUF6198 family protein [Anaeromicropila herbilytica]BCN31397.1 membrane protein [Anaeromicropila herbilytica]
MSNIKLLIKKLIIFFLGVWIIQTGVVVFINTAIGSDPFTVFTLGISKVIGITVGRGNQLITFVLLLLIIFALRKIKEINIGTIIALVFAGIFMNMMVTVLEPLHLSSLNIIIKIILLCLSCVIIAIGFSMEKATNLGVAPNDLFILLFTEKVNIEYRWVRIGFDLSFMIIGLLLYGIDSFGVTVGIGTVINALIQGPIIQFFMPRVEKFLSPMLSNENISEAVHE